MQQQNLQMKSHSLLIRSFFKQLSNYPVTKYCSKPHTIQSGVGLIFKFPKIHQIQSKENFDHLILNSTQQIANASLLFVQRAGYHSDKNAYNIVFPGGQCDENQTDLQACQRQLKEQINIVTQSQCIYLGQLPSNFYYLKKRGKQVHISCHIYCLKSSQQQWKPTLNPDELKDYKWVSFSQLFDKQNYKRRNQIMLGVFERMSPLASKIAKQNITNVTMPELDLGMDRCLWGLTLWIWSYVLQMSFEMAKPGLASQERLYVSGMIEMMKGFELQFKPNSFYKYPALVIASGWHYFYRVLPFKYVRQKKRNLFAYIPFFIILAIIMALLNFYFSITN